MMLSLTASMLMAAVHSCPASSTCRLQERHRREVAEQDFEKASKAAAAEQARRDKEQVRVKAQQEVQQRLAAHRQGKHS